MVGSRCTLELCASTPDLLFVQSHLDAILLGERPIKRRSAGIPYLLLGVLSGSTIDPSNLQYAFDRLFTAMTPNFRASDATRSHVVNILRVLFQDGKLSGAVSSYLEQAFVVAIEGFGAEK